MIKTENKLLPLIQSLKIKTLSEELQDYKVKSIKGLKIISIWKGRVTRLQEGKDYKSLSEGKGELSWT